MAYRSSHIRPADGTVVLPPERVTPTPRRLVNAALDVAALPLVAALPRRHVEVCGERVPLHYEFGRWAWRTERCVEIALGRRAMAGRGASGVLEVGNVLPLAGLGGHTVVDKYEAGDGVLNVDIIDFSPGRQFDLVVSLSTVEHVGWDEEPREPGKAALALQAIGRLGESLLVTIPVGYHRELERAFVDGLFDEVMLLAKASRLARWEPRPLPAASDIDYGQPFACGNGILVGVRGRPFLS